MQIEICRVSQCMAFPHHPWGMNKWALVQWANPLINIDDHLSVSKCVCVCFLKREREFEYVCVHDWLNITEPSEVQIIESYLRSSVPKESHLSDMKLQDIIHIWPISSMHVCFMKSSNILRYRIPCMYRIHHNLLWARSASWEDWGKWNKSTLWSMRC